MNFFRKVQVLIWKEIQGELRGKEMLSAMLVFSLLVVVTFGFALPPEKELIKQVFPGILWVTLTFAGILGLNRSFTTEKHNDCIYGLMLCPVDRSAIFFAKTVMNLLLMGVVELISVPLFFVMLNYSAPKEFGMFVLILALGTYCFMTVGTFLSALSANTRSSEILLPILMIPMIIPVLISSVQVTRVIFDGTALADAGMYLKLLGTYAVIFTVLPVMLFDYLLEV